jgi:hypothetical protein
VTGMTLFHSRRANGGPFSVARGVRCALRPRASGIAIGAVRAIRSCAELALFRYYFAARYRNHRRGES